MSARTRRSLTFFWTALFVLSLLMQYASFSAPVAVDAAANLTAGTVQGFEVDGDLDCQNAADNPAAIPDGTPPPDLIDGSFSDGDDWLDAAGCQGVVDPHTPPTSRLISDLIDSTADDGFIGGAKEDDTRTWGYTAHKSTPKDDIRHGMAYAKFVGSSAFFFAGATRIVNEGDTHIDFELNRNPFKVYSDGISKPDRSVGDVLVSLEFSNGGSVPVVTVYKVTAVQEFPTGELATFGTDVATASAVHSATNFVDLPDQGLGYAIPTFQFAETAIDLAALGINTGCPGFSNAHIRTRSGGDLDSSQLKDNLPPFPIDLNNCGKVTIIKDAIPNDAQDFSFTSGLGNFSLDDDGDGTLSNTKVFTDVVNGEYTITEGAATGWSLTNIVCDDANGSVSLANRRATINVGPNEEVTCTFTNRLLPKLIVKKLTSPADASGSFSFSGEVSGSIGHNQTIASGFLQPGQYTVTEADPTPPFDLGSITCDDANSTGNVGTRTATYNLEYGEVVTCTFTNVQRGSITIIKDAVPDDAQDFAFTGSGSLGGFSLDDDADSTLSNTRTFTNVVPGSYTVAEAAAAGWDLTNLVCSGTGGSTGTRDGATANISLTAGGSVTCTFTNTKRGTVIVKKVMVGGTGTFTYTGTPNGSISVNNGTIQASVAPGTYESVETALAGWDLTNVVCDDANSTGSVANAKATFNVEAGETVTCTFTNTKRGEIIVKKVMVGGTDTFTYTGTPNGSIAVNNGTLSATVVPGAYVSTETVAAGWDLTSVACDDANSTGSVANANATFNVEAGETVTCTFTNTKRGSIVIDKVTNPSGDPASFEFDPSYGANFSLTDAATPNDSGTLAPGSYTVAELAKAGWDLTALACVDPTTNSSVDLTTRTATINLAAGETVTCTFTNTKRGSIVIDKVTNPSGDTTSFDFDPSYGSDFTLTDAATPNDSGSLVPGTYTVAELAEAGWDLTGLACVDPTTNSSVDLATRTATINLAAGETVTCTFTNTKRGTIIVEKQTSPNGATGTFTFTGDAAGSLVDNGQIVVTNLVPGTYTSTEADPSPSFDLGAIVCDDGTSLTASTVNLDTRTATFKLDPGETVKCVFTNVQRGTITVIKNAQPDSAQNFHYDFTGLDGPVAFDLDDDADPTLSNMRTFSNLRSGSYSVTETMVAGWDLTSLTCEANGTGTSASINGATAAITLADGGSVVCVYVNSKPSISIVKTAGTAADGAEFVTEAGNVTYTYKVKNTGPVTLSSIVVRDDNGTPSSTADDFNATCPKTSLAPNEEMTCTATVAVSSSRTNVAKATGTSDKGTTVEDSDDAVVRIPGTGISKTSNDQDGIVGRGQTVTFTINVDVVQPPVTTAVLTDVLPLGQTYVPGTQTSNPAATSFTVAADGRTLTWTWTSLSADAVVTYNVTIDAGAATGNQTNVATICVSELKDCKSDDETLRVPNLTIDKSFTGNTGGTGPGGIPEAKANDTLTYTLAYDLTNGPVHNGVITDVIPVGLNYVAGSATGNAEFTFSSYNAATRTLTWTAALVSADGSVTYKVKVAVGADELPQPLVNIATIDSDETDKDDDTDRVFVEPPPQIATGTPRITLPPTNTLDRPEHGTSSPGQTLMLVLLGLAGLALAVGFVTPVPARARRRNRR